MVEVWERELVAAASGLCGVRFVNKDPVNDVVDVGCFRKWPGWDGPFMLRVPRGPRASKKGVQPHVHVCEFSRGGDAQWWWEEALQLDCELVEITRCELVAHRSTAGAEQGSSSEQLHELVLVAPKALAEHRRSGVSGG